MVTADLKETFLTLVRLGIGHNTSLPAGEIEWEAIEALAERHGLLGVIVDGVQKLPENQRPPQLIWLRWVGKVMQNEAQYGAQQKASAELALMFHNNGIRAYVLKGAIVSECYPKPSCRLSADLDCFLVNENHNDNENRFDRTWLYRPPVMVSALFLIEHAYSHFLHEGLNWRYVLDWVMFSRKHKDEIDWYVLDALIDEFGFRKFYNVFNEIGQEAFGNTYNSTLSTDSKLSTLNTQLKAKMLADIWAEKKKHKPDSGLKGKMGLAANTWNARWKYHDFSPISMPHALWIQVKGYLFEKNPKVS